MPRQANAIETATYAARMAVRLRELRAAAGLSIEDLEAQLAKLGRAVPRTTLYAYERGKDAGGVDLPHALIPLIAKVYGFPRAGEWLPPK
jgi:transcriptional regulator with XRE-family HTH domain